MRQTEIDYWDKVAKERCLSDGAINDNWLKRQAMMAFFAKYTWMHERVLEIGVGAGVSAAMLKIACGGMWSYIGTDLSPEFAKATWDQWRLKVVQADVLTLPEGSFTRVLALDSLEHVRPEDRAQGYDNIVSRMADGAIMFINIPPHRSLHDEEFDHGFDLRDLHELEARGLSLQKYDTYSCHYKSYSRRYAMAILSK
jgi:SAM-dependent methyltransferase